MPTYDQPHKERRSFMAQAFGGATKNFTIRGPAGKKGFVFDIEVEVTVAMVGTTTVPEVQVGTASGDFTYARFRLGTGAGTGYGTGVKRASALLAAAPGNKYNPPLALSDFTGHISLETAPLPANTDVVISLLAGVDGTPAGTANVHIDIRWF